MRRESKGMEKRKEGEKKSVHMRRRGVSSINDTRDRKEGRSGSGRRQERKRYKLDVKEHCKNKAAFRASTRLARDT